MFGFDPWISCIAYCALYHYAMSVHSMVYPWLIQGTYSVKSTLAWYITFWLVSDRDVQRGSRRAPGSGHDVTGPDMIDLNLPDAQAGSARDGPWKLKLVAKHSLPVESRLGLTVAPAAAALP